MKITKALYEAAWTKRMIATEKYRIQLEKDIDAANTLPIGQGLQVAAAIAAAVRYGDACMPAVEEWRRDLAIGRT